MECALCGRPCDGTAGIVYVGHVCPRCLLRWQRNDVVMIAPGLPPMWRDAAPRNPDEAPTVTRTESLREIVTRNLHRAVPSLLDSVTRTGNGTAPQ